MKTDRQESHTFTETGSLTF